MKLAKVVTMGCLLSSLGLTSTSQAGTKFELTPECKSKQAKKALGMEYKYLARMGEKLASTLKAETHVSHFPAKPEAKVSVDVTDPADGRFVRYTASILKTEASACDFTLVRKDSSACRYSSGDGPESLNQISGLKFTAGRKIKPNTTLTRLQDKQVRAFLVSDDYENAEFSTQALIESTDDKQVNTGELEIEDGRTLTYYGADSGGNATGVFFESGTTQNAGSNSDDSICVK